MRTKMLSLGGLLLLLASSQPGWAGDVLTKATAAPQVPAGKTHVTVIPTPTPGTSAQDQQITTVQNWARTMSQTTAKFDPVEFIAGLEQFGEIVDVDQFRNQAGSTCQCCYQMVFTRVCVNAPCGGSCE